MVWLDRLYLPLMAALSVFVAVANFHAQHIFHTIDKHLVFRARILHGFDTGVVVPSYPIPPTFPMWGYGFVLVLTTSLPSVWRTTTSATVGAATERSAAANVGSACPSAS